MAAVNPSSLQVDPYQTQSNDGGSGADRAHAVGSGRGAALEVQFADGVWRRGRLVERVAGTEPPRQKVQLDDIFLADLKAPVRFDASAYGSTVEVRVDGEWRRGRLVELVRGGDVWGVAFEDGDWAEDVRVNSPDVRYVFAGRGAKLGEKRGRGGDAGDCEGEESRKRVGENPHGKVYVCETCGKACSTTSNLYQHTRSHSREKLPHVCETCGKVFLRPDKLTLHMLWHSGERPHVCVTCGKAFSHSGNLNVHMRIHSGDMPHVCETCGKAFVMFSHLTVHMLKQSWERPHVCETCGKAFTTFSHLTVHMRTHSGEKPHVCKTCGKAFTMSGYLTAHMLMHSGEKPHVCEMCGKAFSRSDNLATHMRTHSGERPHACETCGKAFSHSSTLATHMRTHSEGRTHVCETRGR